MLQNQRLHINSIFLFRKREVFMKTFLFPEMLQQVDFFSEASAMCHNLSIQDKAQQTEQPIRRSHTLSFAVEEAQDSVGANLPPAFFGPIFLSYWWKRAAVRSLPPSTNGPRNASICTPVDAILPFHLSCVQMKKLNPYILFGSNLTAIKNVPNVDGWR